MPDTGHDLLRGFRVAGDHADSFIDPIQKADAKVFPLPFVPEEGMLDIGFCIPSEPDALQGLGLFRLARMRALTTGHSSARSASAAIVFSLSRTICSASTAGGCLILLPGRTG